MKKYVFIQSDRNINVTSGLEVKNITNPALNVKDNMKVKALWPQTVVQLLQGKHLYPSIVADFNTVKSLSDTGKVTISEFIDEIPENYEERSRVLALNKKLRGLIAEKEAKEAKKSKSKKENIEEKTE